MTFSIKGLFRRGSGGGGWLRAVTQQELADARETLTHQVRKKDRLGAIVFLGKAIDLALQVWRQRKWGVGAQAAALSRCWHMPKVFTTLGICPQKSLLFFDKAYFRHMPRPKGHSMKPRELKLDDKLSAELAEIVAATGEPASVIIRLCLRAGLKQIARDNYEVLKLDQMGEPAQFPVRSDDAMPLDALSETGSPLPHVPPSSSRKKKRAA